jgi:pyruvate kinase
MVKSPEETRTKIVCTIGPASRNPETIRELVREGMDVARVNFSHGTQTEHAQSIECVRRVAREEAATVAILADLQGPKLRIGALHRPLNLEPGDWLALTTRSADGSFHVIPLPYPELIAGANVGGRWLFDDGAIEVIVREVRPEVVTAEVLVGGQLSSSKGVNAPGGTSRVAALTEKDREDARFAASCGVDFIALSFVQVAEDLSALRDLLDKLPGGPGIGIIAKIEKREALDDLDRILMVADAVMVARGDLGLEVPPQEVPLHQKEIVRRCNRRGIPVITATQMLQSMVDSPRPTRAEASDVANAILDGTDAVMLSEETAVGRYPVEAVVMMREISAMAEGSMPCRIDDDAFHQSGSMTSVTDAISDATARIADEVGARLIVTSTTSGYTARQVARERPRQPIVALTTDESVLRQMALVWGVVPLLVEDFEGTDEMLRVLSQTLIDAGHASEGDLVVVTAGLPTGGRGTTNLLKVHRLENESATSRREESVDQASP